MHFEEWWVYGGWKKVLTYDLENPLELKEMARLIYFAGNLKKIDQNYED